MVDFQIEYSLEAFGRGYVIARQLDPRLAFAVGPGARLGGVALEEWLEVPRSLDVEGDQRTDVFAFCLKRLDDRDHLKVGARVSLAGEIIQ